MSGKSEKKPKAIVKTDETIQDALARIQRCLKAPKNQFNKFANFKYRSCEDILEAVKPLLGKFYLTLSDDVCMIGDRYYIKATAMLSDGVNSICGISYARESLSKKGMDDSQVTGSTSSYARKYALNGLFAIDDTKDTDVKNPAEKKTKESLLTETDMKAIAKVLQDINNAKGKEELEKIALEIKEMKLSKGQTNVLREAYASKSKKFQTE